MALTVSVAFSADDYFVISSGADMVIKLWSASDKQCAYTLRGHLDWVTRAVMDPDGIFLASSSYDETAKLWRIADWLAQVTLCLGRMGADVTAHSRTELAEVHLRAAGASSTMPHKQNPVPAEALVALARMATGLMGVMQGASLTTHQRDGAAGGHCCGAASKPLVRGMPFTAFSTFTKVLLVRQWRRASAS